MLVIALLMNLRFLTKHRLVSSMLWTALCQILWNSISVAARFACVQNNCSGRGFLPVMLNSVFVLIPSTTQVKFLDLVVDAPEATEQVSAFLDIPQDELVLMVSALKLPGAN